MVGVEYVLTRHRRLEFCRTPSNSRPPRRSTGHSRGKNDAAVEEDIVARRAPAVWRRELAGRTVGKLAALADIRALFLALSGLRRLATKCHSCTWPRRL